MKKISPTATIRDLLVAFTSSPLTGVAYIRAGLSFGVLDATAQGMGLTQLETSKLLRIPSRALTSRRSQRLTPVESEGLMRLIFVWSRASEVLGTSEKAWHWLRNPNRALSGEAPSSLLDTGLGARIVEDVLGQIEQGVYS